MLSARSEKKSTEIGSEKTLAAYISMVDNLAVNNGSNLLWWCSAFASKNRFLAPLGAIVVGRKKRSFFRRVLHKIVRIIDTVRVALHLISEAQKARSLFASRLPETETVYLIKSFGYASSVRQGKFVDPFFGELADCLGEELAKGHTVLTVITDFDESGGTAEKMAAMADNSPIPLEYFLSTSDVLSGLLAVVKSQLFSRFRVPESLEFLGENVRSAVADSLSGSGGAISLRQYLHYDVARNIAQQYTVSGCAITYEGNPWERMFVAGLKSVQPQAPVAGYQHSVVPLAAAGVFPGPHEVEVAPLPDVVVTTGEEPARIIREFGSYPGERIIPACALRYSYLHELKERDITCRKQENVTVLVVPEGVAKAIDLVSYALKQASTCPDIQFRIRTHPLTPLPFYLDQLGISLDTYDNVVESKGRSLVEDIMSCDAVLYWGTTVSLEALMAGIPLIHFDRGELLSYDPLFDFSDFKWVVDKTMPLAEVVEVITQLPDGEYEVRASAGRAYVKRYFHPVTKEAMQAFLPSCVR